MKRELLSLAAGAALLVVTGAAQAQAPDQAQADSPGPGMPMMNPEQMQQMMQQGRPGMGPGMMRGGHGGPGMGHGPMLRIMFAVMDADGNGAISLEEVQEFHARIFRSIDADDDGSVTQAELRAFMTGAPAAAEGGNQ